MLLSAAHRTIKLNCLPNQNSLLVSVGATIMEILNSRTTLECKLFSHILVINEKGKMQN